MKKTFLAALAAGALMVGIAGAAGATFVPDCGGVACPDDSIKYTDTYDAPGLLGIHLDAGEHVTWTFDIKPDGFDPVTQDVTWASVGLKFLDDELFQDWLGVYEWADFEAGGNSYAAWEVDTGTANFALTSLVGLNVNGTVLADLWATRGDFIFYGGTLTACAENVPEPMTMLLMGTGLAGLMALRRRKED
jgi:hypothetical protein